MDYASCVNPLDIKSLPQQLRFIIYNFYFNFFMHCFLAFKCAAQTHFQCSKKLFESFLHEMTKHFSRKQMVLLFFFKEKNNDFKWNYEFCKNPGIGFIYLHVSVLMCTQVVKNIIRVILLLVYLSLVKNFLFWAVAPQISTIYRYYHKIDMCAKFEQNRWRVTCTSRGLKCFMWINTDFENLRSST